MTKLMLTYEELAEIMSKSAGVTVAPAALESDTVRFEDIDVDSLGLLSIVAELERRYRLQLGVEAESSQTPRELLDMVNTLTPKGD
ncbi:phosphopantetheine-binding protein [Nonomuraea polychroma]|uniref:phosphopantetheine-binding protein n=1 Tax=Nonomuraea polychroma TaxID=46176 RepID=UPI003D9498F1